MIKKLTTISLLLIIILLSFQVVSAQRAIDPNLKPLNSPEVPKTGPAKLECIRINDKNLHSNIVKELTTASTIQDKLKREEAITKAWAKYKDDYAPFWDDNSSMCRGYEEEPINAFIQILAGALLMVTGGVAVIIIAVAGIMYATAGGRQSQMEFAKNTLTYGLIGMVVIIFSYYIVRFVLELLIG